jgi:predicted O-methyltransferase YrrM
MLEETGVQPVNEQVAEVIRRLESFMATVDDALAIPREAGEFVHGLLLATRAKRAVEIGTSYGYSGLWIASALSQHNGTLVTIDHDPKKHDKACSYFESAGLAGCVDLRCGNAADLLPTLDAPIDFVLNDADKANCLRYVDLLVDKLSDRAIVLTDNTTSHATELAEFVAWIRERPDFHSSHVPIGNGMELSVKLGG